MKKNRMFFALFLSLVFIFILPGCEKGEEPVVTGSKPSISVSASPETVVCGGSSTLNYEFQNLAVGDSAYINGVPVVLFSGQINANNLNNDTTFIFLAKNKYGQTEEIKKIFVQKPPIVNGIVASPSSLPLGGGKSQITISAKNFTEIIYNGLSYTSNKFEVNVKSDSSFNFIVKGPGGAVSVSVLIEVASLTSEQKMLSSGKWHRIGSRKSDRYPTLEWENLSIDFTAPCNWDDTYQFDFYTNKVETGIGELCSGGYHESIYHDFTFNQASMTLKGIDGFPDCFVTFLSYEKMIFVTTYGSQYFYEEVWVH